jgi:hypothetical protein
LSPVNGFYTPLRNQVQLAVKEGFIQAVNLSLIKFVDLQDGESPEQWGQVCIQALENWTWEVRTAV